MLTSDLTITDLVQRRRVLGRRADMRLARALRRPIRLHETLSLRITKGLQARKQQIRHWQVRHWQDGSFVERTVSLPRAA